MKNFQIGKLLFNFGLFFIKNRKVGIVLFSDRIVVLGDCFEKPKICSSTLDFAEYILCGKLCFDTHMKNSLKDSFDMIIQKLDEIEESGCTSLGPSLLISAGMLSKAPNGGSLILCTDGCANSGLGMLNLIEKEKESIEFYNMVADFANENGISINITTIKGDDQCRIDILGDLTDNTNGKINRVNPNDITNDFQNIIKQEFLAHKVEIKLFLHKALKLRASFEKDFQNVEGKYYKKILGNIREDYEVFFEYDLQETDDKTLEYYFNVLKGFPLQVQINFFTKEGNFLKILTVMQEISNQKEEVEKQASIQAIKKTAIRKACTFIRKEKYGFLIIYTLIFHRKIFDSGDFYSMAEKAANKSGKYEDKVLLEEFKKEKTQIEELVKNQKAKKSPHHTKTHNFFENSESSKSLENFEFEQLKKSPDDRLNVINENINDEFEMTDEFAIKLMQIQGDQLRK